MEQTDPNAAAEKRKQTSMTAIAYNVRILTYTRSMLAAIAGACAGILGFQGLQGFLFYAVASVILSAFLHLYSAKLNPGKHIPNGALGIWTHEVTGSAFSYVLFWTLVYGLVHVYD
ncbi:hypothetical protein HDU97_005951 [Phlyctochytrium planicorne]|nr:hypothetical protein HDU97_005951 [Phlyctochytrium planicorne]